jgi:hypothetical protein
MKMTDTDFQTLRHDFGTVIEAQRTHDNRCVDRSKLSMRDAWEIFHIIQLDRSNDNSHPVYGTRVRYVDYVGPHATLYYEGYSDEHINTALRKIVALLAFTESKSK